MKSSPSPAPQLSDLEQSLRRHVDTLAGLVGPRHMGQPSSIEATKAYIHRELSALGDRVDRETYPVNHLEAQNLFIQRPGRNRPEEIVILGAHYDTVHCTPGADDNASAVAVLIEVARLMRGEPTRRSTRYVAFANEEPPHFYLETMGSQIHARGCRSRNERITGMICLEMVGYFTDKPGTQKYPSQIPSPIRKCLPSTGNFLGIVSNFRSLPLLRSVRKGFKKADRMPLLALPLPEAIHQIRLSDHAQFWDQRYPALMVTDTSFFRNPHYHMPGDTPDTLNYSAMAHVALGIAGALREVAGCAT